LYLKQNAVADLDRVILNARRGENCFVYVTYLHVSEVNILEFKIYTYIYIYIYNGSYSSYLNDGQFKFLLIVFLVFYLIILTKKILTFDLSIIIFVANFSSNAYFRSKHNDFLHKMFEF
jgi:hypothetical protein